MNELILALIFIVLFWVGPYALILFLLVLESSEEDKESNLNNE